MKKVANLIEIMQKKDIREKTIAFQKLEKMQITKDIGLLLIEAANYDYKVEDGYGGISSSLISLCFKEYYDEYSVAIEKIFKYLNEDAQNRVIFLLSSIDNKSSLELYVDLVLKYYKESIFIPISNLFERPYLYDILFPKLYKALKFSYVRNNILIILNDYLNAGVVKEEDLKKNKKIIQDSIIRLFDKALQFKFKNTDEALRTEEYFDLRFFLEISINIESYVSNKRTKEILNKLFKRKDTQLSLFILENFIRKDMDISKLNLNMLAKDESSRYPLFDMLSIYGMENLIPKRYMTGKMIAKSDFYINFMMQTKYKEDLEEYKYYDERVVEGYKYYIFKFNYTYVYDNRTSDFVTNYLINQAGLNKYSLVEEKKEFVGISGGYINDDAPSLIAFDHKRLIYSKVDEKENIEDVINKLLDQIKNDIIKSKEEKRKKEEKLRKEQEEKRKQEEKLLKEQEKKNKKKEKIATKDKKKEKQENIVTKEKKHIFKFSYILVFLFFIFICLLISWIVFLYDPNLIKGNNVVKSSFVGSKINNKDLFTEINATDIYNQDSSEYYVLLYKKNNNEKNTYYTYINEYINNNIKVYYVNLNDKKNKFLYENNDLDFVLTTDRFLKVKDKDFEYYVDGKNNILKEMQMQINSINKEKSKK